MNTQWVTLSLASFTLCWTFSLHIHSRMFYCLSLHVMRLLWWIDWIRCMTGRQACLTHHHLHSVLDIALVIGAAQSLTLISVFGYVSVHQCIPVLQICYSHKIHTYHHLSVRVHVSYFTNHSSSHTCTWGPTHRGFYGNKNIQILICWLIILHVQNS